MAWRRARAFRRQFRAVEIRTVAGPSRALPSPPFSTGSDAMNRRPPSPVSPSTPSPPPDQYRDRSPPRSPRRPNVRITCPQERNNDHSRHGHARLRPNRPGPNRTERGLEIDPNETPTPAIRGHVRNLRPTAAPSGVRQSSGEDPQLLALELQAEAFAQHARGAAPEGTTADLLLAGGGSQRRQSQRRANNASPILCGCTAASRVEVSTPFGESALQAAFAAPGAMPGPMHRSWSGVGSLRPVLTRY